MTGNCAGASDTRLRETRNPVRFSSEGDVFEKHRIVVMMYYAMMSWLLRALGYLALTHIATASITYNGNEVIEFEAGQTFKRTCWSFYESVWVLPDNEQYRDENEKDPLVDGRASINQTRTTSGWFKLRLTLRSLRHSDTGFYTCKAKSSGLFNDVTTASGIGKQYSRVYVLVSRPQGGDIFLHKRDDKETTTGRLVPVWKNRDSFVPCLVTRLDADLQLIIDGVSNRNYTYDPRYGFLLPFTALSFDEPRSGRCMARVRGNGTAVTDKIQILLIPLQHTNLSNPKVVLGGDPYPYKGGQLKLYCVYPGNSSNPALAFINCSWTNIPDRTGVHLMGASATNKTLWITHLLLNHSGNYTCTCRHVLDEDSETAAVYDVDVNPTKGRILHLSSTTSATAEHSLGQSVQFAVRLVAWPSDEIRIEWHHRYRNAFSQTELIELVENRQSDILKLENLQVNNTGVCVYRITAGGDLQREVLFSLVVHGQSNTSRIFISEARKIDNVVDGRFLELGNSYDLYCIGEGHPLPHVQLLWSACTRPTTNEQCAWNEVGENEGRMMMTAGDFQTAIRIRTVAQTSGRYVCRVTSPSNETIFSDPKMYIVSDIKDAQKHKAISITLLTADSTGEIYETDNIIARCHYQPLVYKKIRWDLSANASKWKTIENRRNGLLLFRSFGRFTASEDIKFTNIQRRHEGLYACVADYANDLGSGHESRQFEIVINQTIPLHFGNSSSLKQLNAAAGYGPVEIYCDAYGAPSPMITWLKDGAYMHTNATGSVEESKVRISNGNRTLTILHPTGEDEGVYTCRLTNRMESISRNFVLRISAAFPGFSFWTLGLAALLALCALVIIGLSICLYLSKRRKKQAIAIQMSHLRELYADLMTSPDERIQLNPDQPINEQTENLRYDRKFEIDMHCLTLGRLLGEGQFGRVYEGVLVENQTDPRIVAVKVPKVGTNADQQKALLSEFKIMSYIGEHINVLRLVGAVTKHIVSGRLYVVVEYCKLGSLSDYLKRHRDHFINELVRSSEDEYESSVDVDGYLLPNCHSSMKPMKPGNSDEAAVHQRYRGQLDPAWSRKHAENRLDEDHLSTADLLSCAYQIANGMDYLASKKIIHRDLALRNVLLNEHKIVKICDFGLARRDYTYHTTKVGVPLPVKWMAIESILYQEYTEKSDLWSFGIVTWEIFSLAETPYPGQAVDRNFITWLKHEENRLPCPEYAPDEVYALTRQCWLSIPDDRPTFAECRRKMGAELIKCNAYYYNEMNSLLRIAEDDCSESSSFVSSLQALHSCKDKAIVRVSADSDEAQQCDAAMNEAYFEYGGGRQSDDIEMQPLRKVANDE